MFSHVTAAGPFDGFPILFFNCRAQGAISRFGRQSNDTESGKFELNSLRHARTSHHSSAEIARGARGTCSDIKLGVGRLSKLKLVRFGSLSICFKCVGTMQQYSVKHINCVRGLSRMAAL